MFHVQRVRRNRKWRRHRWALPRPLEEGSPRRRPSIRRCSGSTGERDLQCERRAVSSRVRGGKRFSLIWRKSKTRGGNRGAARRRCRASSGGNRQRVRGDWIAALSLRPPGSSLRHRYAPCGCSTRKARSVPVRNIVLIAENEWRRIAAFSVTKRRRGGGGRTIPLSNWREAGTML